MPAEDLRILLAIKNMDHGGGAEAIVYDIYNELKTRKDVRVKLVAFENANVHIDPSLGYFEEQLISDPDFHFCHCSVNLSLTSKNRVDVSQYMQIVNDFKPHVIHSHLFVAEINSRAVLFPAAKYFTHTHDNMKQLTSFSYKTLMSKSLLTNFYERQFLIQRYKRANNHFITISKDTNAYFKRILPRSLKKNVLLLNNAINTRRFSNVNHERNRDKLRLLNVGSFREVKNQQFLVDVADELRKRGENFEMTLVGHGPTFAQVKEKVESKGLQEVVLMPANVVNVEDYYRDANVYVHSTILESFGLVYLEAMSAGLPIVTLDAGGNRDLIIDGETGFMIRKQDAVEFADKIIRLFNDDALYTKFACNGATFAKSYDIVPYTDRLIDLYRNA